jgi:hypothetical protein
MQGRSCFQAGPVRRCASRLATSALPALPTLSELPHGETLEGSPDMANTHQKRNLEKRKPESERPNPPAQTAQFARVLGMDSFKRGSSTARDPMSQHKFRVGQLVDYNPGWLRRSASAGQYRILRLLPAEGGDLLYRIKSTGEAFERVAKERELA